MSELHSVRADLHPRYENCSPDDGKAPAQAGENGQRRSEGSSRTPRVTPAEAIARFTVLRAELMRLEADLHAEDLTVKRDHAEDAAEHCDYAVDSLTLLVNGDDGL